jgi:energy-coupling factor transporter ATP-binding protein EcfA2
MSDTIIAGLESWFAERPKWLQDAAQRIIQNGDINENDLNELIALCKAEVGIADSNCALRLPVSIPKGNFQGYGDKVTFQLKTISDLRGINALAPRKPLEFDSAPLTIIYGQNASGKSGYVRALKHACGARKPGNLFGNVFDTSNPEQGCTFKIISDTITKEIKWSPSVGALEELREIEIYDADCAYVYVNEENELAYEPRILSLFSKLTDICVKVGQSLKNEINRTVSKKPTLPTEWLTTEGGAWYDNLSHQTAEIEIDSRCQWNPDCETELSGLKQRLMEANPADKAKRLRKTKTNVEGLLGDLQRFLNNLSDEKCATYLAAKADAGAKRKTADQDAKKVFENAPLEGVGTESWKLMWEQARNYSKEIAYQGIPFPNVTEDARCVLCQQFIAADAKQRLLSFEEFVKGSLERQAKDAEKNLKDIEDDFGGILTENNFNLRMDSSEISDEKERQAIVDFYTALEMRKSSLLSVSPLVKSTFTPLPGKETLDFFQKRIDSMEKLATTYEADTKGENREALQKRVKELEAQKWLSQQRNSIEDEITRLKTIQKIEKAYGLTNTQTLSKKKSSLADGLITEAYINRFGEELKVLGASRIQVEIMKTRSEYGHVFHKIRLKNCLSDVCASDVLSEGEFRIISLAAFLADVEGRENNAPFIFDDPISSLDQIFEESTVDRLIELCKSRQVIIFTHRLSMLALLEDAAKKQKIEPHVVSLRIESWGIGEPSETPMFAKKPEKAITSLLGERLSKAQKVFKETGRAEYEPIAKGICSDIRIVLERLIENDLLADVVHRFRRDIYTKNKLHKLARIKFEDCKFLDDLMTKYSKYEHSQSDETPIPLPSPEEIEMDLESIRTWREEFEKRSI